MLNPYVNAEVELVQASEGNHKDESCCSSHHSNVLDEQFGGCSF